MTRNTVFIFTVSFLLIQSCIFKNDESITEPIVSGLQLIESGSGFPLGDWRNPNPNWESDQLIMYVPSPNPANVGISIYYEPNNINEIDLWITSARISSQSTSNYISERGSDALIDGRVKTIYRGRSREDDEFNGIYRIKWDLKDHDGIRVPAGFYRVNLSYSNEVYFHDIYIGNPGDSYLQMRGYLRDIE